MKFKQEKRGDVVVFHLDGELVGGPDTTLFSEKLRDTREERQKNKIVVAMSKVPVMNSSGCGILIGALTTFRNAGGDVKIAGMQEKIKELLKIMKLDRVFEVYDDIDEAVESFSRAEEEL